MRHTARDPIFASSFASLLERGVRDFGNRDAIRHKQSATSYRALGERAGAIQAAVKSAGANPGDRCAVFLRDPVDAAAAFFGVLGLGAVGLNVNELYRPRQLEYVLNHARAKVLITTREILETLPRSVNAAARVVDVNTVRDSAAFEVVRTSPDLGAQITYTSASTGLPKGVLMSHEALWAGVRIVADYLELCGDDRIASLLPFSFVYGFNQLTTSLFTGATLIVERSTLAVEIVESLRRERVSVVAAVPPLWQQLLAVRSFREDPLDSLRVMTCAGGRLPPSSVRELRRAQPHARLFLMYGLTEVFRSTYLPADEVDAHPDSMGRAIPESVVYVARDDGTLAADGEVGELVHGGPTTAIGYLDDEENTRRVFRPNPFRQSDPSGPARVVFSGDLVRRDENGLLYYVARRDRIIKTLGYRVSPDEITDVVSASGEVVDAAIVAEPDSVRGERIVACVVLRHEGSLERLQRYCQLELPRHMHPRFVVLAAIPRNASGKHDIPALTSQVASPTPVTSSDRTTPRES